MSYAIPKIAANVKQLRVIAERSIQFENDKNLARVLFDQLDKDLADLEKSVKYHEDLHEKCGSSFDD